MRLMNSGLFIIVLLAAPACLTAYSVKSFAAGQADLVLECGNSVSSVKIWTEGERLYFRMDDIVGFKNFPLYDGVVTPVMLPLINRGAEDLKEFDHQVLISWERSQCRFDRARPFLVDCSGRAKIHFPENTQITASGLGVTTERQEHFDLTADLVKFHLGLSTPVANFTHYYLGFPFNRANCRSSYSEVQ